MNFTRLTKLFFAFLLVSAPSFPMDKLFVGVNAGIISSNTETQEMKNRIKDTDGIQKHNFYGGIFTGYNHLIEGTPVFVGTEISMQMYDMDSSKERTLILPYTNYSVSVKSNKSAAAVIKLGLVINDAIIYGKAGLSYAYFMTRVVDRGTTAARESVAEKKSHRYAPVLGLGLDFRLNNNWIIGVDYTVASYSSFSVPSASGNLNFSSTVQMKSLRLVYSF